MRITPGLPVDAKTDAHKKNITLKSSLPKSGLHMADEWLSGTGKPLSRPWKPHHLRLELDTACRGTRYAGDWISQWNKGLEKARQWHSGIELAVLFTPEY